MVITVCFPLPRDIVGSHGQEFWWPAVKRTGERLSSGLGGAAVWPVVARAQQTSRIPQIGFLYPGVAAMAVARIALLRDGLRPGGYSELPGGKGVVQSDYAGYAPKSEALTGKRNPPPITKIEGTSNLMAQ